jgi:RNA polymerase sigma-70 factor (ECF subfamily)
LVEQAQKGDKAAFQQLVLTYDQQIYGLIRRYISDRDLANDVYQEVFMSAYKNIQSFSFQSEFSTWLYRIAVNASLSQIRKDKRYKHEPFQEMSIHSNAKEHSTLITDVFELAKTLPEKQRLVFFMRFQNDLKLSEIAEAMSVDLGTVKGYLFRALKKIRTALEIDK